MWIGLEPRVAGLLVLVGAQGRQGQLVGAVTWDASIEPAVRDATSVATSLLVQVATPAIIVGVPLILVRVAGGPGALGAGHTRLPGAPAARAAALAYWATAGCSP